MAAPAIIAGAWYGDREAVWEFTFNYHVCALVTVACLAAWPAAGAFTFYGFESLIDQSRFLHQFSGFRSGALTTHTTTARARMTRIASTYELVAADSRPTRAR